MPVYEFEVTDGPTHEGYWGDVRQEAATPADAEMACIAYLETLIADDATNLDTPFCLALFAVDGVHCSPYPPE